MPIVLAARLWKVDRRATWSGTSTPMAIAVPETPMSMEFSATAPQSSHPRFPENPVVERSSASCLVRCCSPVRMQSLHIEAIVAARLTTRRGLDKLDS